MTIATGTKLGPYEVIAAIGAGGMGEVYRARDPKLGRDVAIKVLPEAFARDAARMARFQREAKVLASLNHPNIATIHGLEDSSGTYALVMELVEGPTLADRIRQGPIPVEEALRIAKQITEALEYAHEHGIVHRDLKPANIKITTDDTVKVLDFGLAKALEGDPASIDISTSPTISRMATQQGILLGTAAYMSPEQAKGKSVDRRADIWAFGCVLYEMLTGKTAFSGETVTETLAAVITGDPNWSQLPARTPMRVRVLLRRCLEKDARQRLRDIGEARVALEEVLSGVREPTSALSDQLLPPTQLMRFEIGVPEKIVLAATSGVLALSPDGRQLGFVAVASDQVQRVWVRALDSLEARPLADSVVPGGQPIFWSFDSRYIAFDAGGGKLKKIDISGGPAQTLCDVGGNVVGGSWNEDGTIIFGTMGPGGLMRVSANGGPASPLTTLNSSHGDMVHVFPVFLPDGRHFIYFRLSNNSENTGVYVGSLDAKPEEQSVKRLLATSYCAAYVPSADSDKGQLLFLRDEALMAQPFDARRLEFRGEAVTVTEGVGTLLNYGFFSASVNGLLVYRASGSSVRLAWFDRRGRTLGTTGEAGPLVTIALSPDGTRAAVARLARNLSLWLVDFSRGTSARFTFGSTSNLFPVWSPDGSRIFFASNREGNYDLYQKPASGARDEELLLKSEESKYPTSCSHDGRFLLYTVLNPTRTKYNLWVLPLEGDRKPFPYLQTEFNESGGQFSPDGRWVAYSSDESGRVEVYVRPFSADSGEAGSGVEGKWLVSTGGGTQPRWSRDGKVLYYLAPDRKLMAVEVTTDPVFQAGVPKALFQAPVISTSVYWDVAPDGKRFLFPSPMSQAAQAPFTVVLNWQSLLKK